MEIASSWTELIGGVLLIASAIGAVVQWRKSLRIRQAEFLDGILQQIQSLEFMKFFYLIDYDENWYGAKFHEGGDIEQTVDTALLLLCKICYLKQNRLIGTHEFTFFSYLLGCVFSNSGIKNYFYNLHHASAKMGSKSMFVILEEYAKRNNLLEEGFDDPNAYKQPNSPYRKVLPDEDWGFPS